MAIKAQVLPGSGFEAVAYKKGGQIVISYAGTYFNDPSYKDLKADAILGFGVVQQQLIDAAVFYKEVEETYGRNIILTGHSLGGGLAAAIGVFFNQRAVTFDPAPFRLLVTKVNANSVAVGLKDFRFAPDTELLAYSTTETSVANALPGASIVLSMFLGALLGPYMLAKRFPITIRGEENVSGYALDGELLTSVMGNSSFERDLVARLKILGSPLDIIRNAGVGSIPSSEMHSMALMILIAREPRFAMLPDKLPSLYTAFIDKSLYGANMDSSTVNFVERLINAEYGGGAAATGRGVLGRFADDLDRLTASTDGLSVRAEVQKALTIAAMEAYYFQNPSDTTVFFVNNNNGIHLSFKGLGTKTSKALPRLVNAINGGLSNEEIRALGAISDRAQVRDEIGTGRLMAQDAWHIQSGSAGMIWTASEDARDAAVGGSQTDVLDGGDGGDILIGNNGSDILTGGSGNDILLGGEGSDWFDGGTDSDFLVGGQDVDTYQFNGTFGQDIIQDADGVIRFASTELAGGRAVAGSNAYKADGFSYVRVANSGHVDLVITQDGTANRITVRGWQPGQLGITLDDTPIAVPPPSTTVSGDYIKKLRDDDPTRYALDANGNFIDVGSQPGAADLLRGTSAKDALLGLGGNDALAGYDGDDRIEGGDGGDLLFGGYGADTIDGGAGTDFIYGSGLGALVYPVKTTDAPPAALGPEYIRGFGWVVYDAAIDGNGQHIYQIAGAYELTLEGDAGNLVDGGAGDDRIRAGSGDDIAHGGADNDDVLGLAGGDLLFGDSGNDVLRGDGSDLQGYAETVPGGLHGSDVLVGGEGNDRLYGQGANDELYGSEGDDVLFGDDDDAQWTPLINHGGDYLDGGDGTDTLVGGGGEDALFGGSGNDAILGDDVVGRLPGANHGDDQLDGEDGDDQLVGGGGDDTLTGGVGNDRLWGDDPGVALEYHGDDYLDGGEGSDYLESGAGNDVLFGGDGIDTMLGGAGGDELYGEMAADQMSGGDGDDYLDGGEGDDTIQGGNGDDEMFGDAGNDLMFGQAGADDLDGEDGSDQLQGGDGNDTLSGAAGDDFLIGDAGDDVVDGGVGNDELQGSAGNDRLVGDEGNDRLFGQAGDDTLDEGAGDGSLVGGDGNDGLSGGDGNDVLFGEAGNDVLAGGAGWDSLIGGDGDDSYIFGFGDSPSLALAETIDDALGRNHLVFQDVVSTDDVTVGFGPFQGYWTIDTGSNVVLVKGLLSGAMADVAIAGVALVWQEFVSQTLNMTISQSTSSPNQQFVGGRFGDTLYGLGGGSTFWGGKGNDTIVGGAGNNTYVFNRGDGHDTVNETSRTPPTSTVRFGAGIGVDDLMLSVYGTQLRIGLRGSAGDALDLAGFSSSDSAASIGIAGFSFADGQTLSYQALLQRGIAIGGSSGDDALLGTAAPDTLDGGAGNDLLSGKQGADTYLFGHGSGNDTIADQDPQVGGGDRLLLGAGVTIDDLILSRYQDDLVLRIAGGADSARLMDYFAPVHPDAIELIQFEDGTQLVAGDVDALIQLHNGEPILGGAGNDVLYGSSGDDAIDGAAGDDRLYGDAGNDQLTGGAGNDVMDAGAGSDLYVIGAFSGSDVIDERSDGDPAGIDTVRFGDDVTAQGLAFVASGDDLVVRDDAHGIDLTVKGQLQGTSAAGQIERFVFADGVVLTAQEVAAAAKPGSPMSDRIQGLNLDDDISAGHGHDVVYGGGGADRLRGDQGNDSLYGENGNDALYGGSGEDVLNGAAGNDLLDGGAGGDRLDAGDGDDLYAFGLDAGNDIVVQDASGVDAVQLAAGIGAANVALFRVSSPPAADLALAGDSLVLQLNGGSDQLWIANYFAPQSQGYIEHIRFADGSSWDYAAVAARLASPGGAAGTLVATRKADTFTIDHWNDVISNPTPTSGDKALSSVSFRLPDSYLTSFTLTGTLNLFAVPAGPTTAIYGNGGDNRFESADPSYAVTYYGGQGNDAYLTRSTSDLVTTGMDPAALGAITVVEQSAQGMDTYLSGYWSAQLPAAVENLWLIAPNPVSVDKLTFFAAQANDFTHRLIGNALDNTIDATLYEDQLVAQWWYAYRGIPLTGAGSFRLDGGAGADTLIGGQGDDTYVIDNAADIVIETGVSRSGADHSNDTLETPFEASLAQWPQIENITLTGGAAVGASGDSKANRLDGALNAAANRLSGGAGNDTYVVGIGDTVNEQAGEGSDTVVVAATPTALVRLVDYSNVENLRLAGSLGNVDANGDASGNTLTGSLGDNRLDGAEGDDVIVDQSAEDTITYAGQFAAADRDLLSGAAGADTLTSYGGDDTLAGGAGDDALYVHGRYAASGGAQASTVTVRFGFGDGNDTLTRFGDPLNRYVVAFGSGVRASDLSAVASGTTLSLSLSDGSSLQLYGGMDSGDATSPAPGLDLTLSFDDGVRLGQQQLRAMLRTSDRVTASDLADLLLGGAASDAIAALGGDDVVLGADGGDLLDGGAGNDALHGGAGADVLVGGAGNDTLAGGAGADTYRLSRGFGRDAIDDLVGAPGGIDDGSSDTIEFDATVAVSDVAVYRQVSGATPVGLVLALPAGGDSVDLAHTYTAGDAGAIEQVRFADGTQWDLVAMKARIGGEVGGSANDMLSGTAAADVLDGRAGADTMTGLGGDDAYFVDLAGDLVIEAANAGIDTVTSTIDYTLPINVERLQLVGVAGLRGVGNALSNVIAGNAGANRLDGAAGADTMSGAAGDDVYVVDVVGDVVVEQAGEGIDRIESAIAYALPTNVEQLVLTGTAKIAGTGNALDNVLVGNSAVNTLDGGAGNDRLDGGAGTDSMTGGAGDDGYVVDAANDKTIEAAGGGYDTVESSLSWTLAGEVERLFLTGTSAINGGGNASGNWLIGNDAINALDGAAGSDVLLGRGGADALQDGSGNNAFDGGAGADTLRGGVVNDLFVGASGADVLTLGGGADIVAFNRGDGADTIGAPTRNAGLGERNDTISIGQANWSDLALAREGADLLLKLGSVGDSLRFKDWYLGAANQTVTRLQWIVDSSAEYAAGSADGLRNSRVCVLDFGQLVAAYDAARTADPALGDWRPPEANLSAARSNASDTMAYGGVLGYRYAHDGSLSNVGVGAAVDPLADVAFGSSLQAIAGGGQAAGGVLAQADAMPDWATDPTVAQASTLTPADDRYLVTLADVVLLQDGEKIGEAPGAHAIAAAFIDVAPDGPESPGTIEIPRPGAATLQGPPDWHVAPDFAVLAPPDGDCLGRSTMGLPTATPAGGDRREAGFLSTPLSTAASMDPMNAMARPQPDEASDGATLKGSDRGLAAAALFPRSSMMGADLVRHRQQEDELPTRHDKLAADRWVRRQWAAMDAWAALDSWKPSSALSTSSAGATIEPQAFLGMSASGAGLGEDMPVWEVTRVEQVNQFRLARL